MCFRTKMMLSCYHPFLFSVGRLAMRPYTPPHDTTVNVL
jgi:hypothetical protein